MTVIEMAEQLGLEFLHSGDVSRNVDGGYVGDLLSWVMGRAGQGCAWITIMSNLNVAAVAGMVDAACVILAEGVQPDEQLVQKFSRMDCAVLSSELSSFELAWKIHEALG